MLRILGSPKKLCDGLTRRDLLRAGTLGLSGVGLSDLLRSDGHAGSVSDRPSGRAKHCILLYLFGAASQLESFDVKPDAPDEVRGPLGTIPTAVPGLRFGEHLPGLARLADRLTVVRSMTHDYPIHGSAYSLTSMPTLDVPLQLDPRDARHWPYIGSVVDYLAGRREGRGKIPRNVALPWPLSSRRPNPARNAGPYGAFLGAAYDPVWTEFEGEGLHEFTYDFNGVLSTVRDPYGGIKPDYRFSFGATETSAGSITLDRLDRRRSLLQQLNQARRQLDEVAATRNLDHFRETAFSLLTSGAMTEALDVHREPPALRERYGMNLFGQSCLTARRLVEAGVPFVTVFWDEFGSVNAGWDTHYQHSKRMKEMLLPGLDGALSTLIEDLESRGLLQETAIACITEHGRTPKLVGDGRDHWSRAYSSVFAGGGFAPGKAVGRTDRIAAEVVETPISPKDILATLYHLLGIDPETLIHDRQGRPMPVAGVGHVRPEMLI